MQLDDQQPHSYVFLYYQTPKRCKYELNDEVRENTNPRNTVTRSFPLKVSETD